MHHCTREQNSRLRHTLMMSLHYSISITHRLVYRTMCYDVTTTCFSKWINCRDTAAVTIRYSACSSRCIYSSALRCGKTTERKNNGVREIEAYYEDNREKKLTGPRCWNAEDNADRLLAHVLLMSGQTRTGIRRDVTELPEAAYEPRPLAKVCLPVDVVDGFACKSNGT